MSANLNWVNKKLAELYGKDISSELPIFRVSFSEGQYEQRKGTFRHFLGDVFIREVTEVATVPKYPYIRQRHVLERLMYHNNPELITNPTYEPIYVFEDKTGASLAVELWACQARISFLFADKPKRTEKDDIAEDEERMKKEKALCKEILANDRPYIPTMIELGEAVSLPNVDNWERYSNDSSSGGSDSSECVPVQDRGNETGVAAGPIHNSGS